MALFINRKSICFGLLLTLSSLCYANSTHNIYMMTLSVLSYVKWTNENPTLCVVENPTTSSLFNQTFSQQKSKFKVAPITATDISSKTCDAVFFSQSNPSFEQKTINNAANRSILSFSNNNPDCEIGSVFCLYSSKSGNTRFKVNLDSLAKTKIHIDPRVLLLAQNQE